MDDVELRAKLDYISTQLALIEERLPKPRTPRTKECIDIAPTTRKKIVELLVAKNLPRSTAYYKVQRAIELVNLAKGHNGLYSGFVEV